MSHSDDDPTYSDQEFALILGKAAELARSPEAVGTPVTGLSLSEMKAIAAEVGLAPALVERASLLLPRPGGASLGERLLGGPLSFRFEGRFGSTLDEHRAAHLLSVVRAEAEERGTGEAGPADMSWTSAGEGSQLLVTAHAEGDGTRVRVVVDRRAGLALTATFSLLGTLAVGVMGAVAFKTFGIDSLGLQLSFLTATVTGGLAAGRALWVSTSRSLREKAGRLMETVSRALTEESGGPGSSGSPPR